MKLISDIINELVDSDKSISSPLLKTKVLATRLKNVDLLNWVNAELNGYDFHGSVPVYRVCLGSISGSYINGRYQFNNQPIPTGCLPPNVEKEFVSMDFYQSVATLESLIHDNKSGVLESIFPAELAAMLEQSLKKKGNPFFQLLKLKKSTPVNSVIQILSVIRSKLLDFMLKLDEEFGNLTEIEDLKLNNERIKTIMSHTIINTGNGNILNTGENVRIKAKLKVSKGNKQELSKILSSNGVIDEDISSLIEILDLEEPNNETRTFGPKVNNWFNRMISKALDGSWEIGVSAAGTMLSEVIQSYYGMK